MMEAPAMMYGKSYAKMSAEDKMYQADSDCRTMIEYAEIMKDKPRYKAAMAKAKEKMKALEYVAMSPADMGKMSMKDYSSARKSRDKSMNGQTDHYA